MTAMPQVREVVLVCLACHHWQVDVRSGAVSDLGGNRAAMWAAGEAHHEHLPDCPGAGGRVKVLGQWVERPAMSDGKQADGLMGAVPLPRWWVSR